jgi:hypothetical protein
MARGARRRLGYGRVLRVSVVARRYRPGVPEQFPPAVTEGPPMRCLVVFVWRAIEVLQGY